MRRGPLLMILASLAFTLMVAAVKVARSELSSVEVMFWRGAVAVPLAAAACWPGGVRVANLRVLALRVVFGFLAMTSFFTAAKGLALAELSLVTRLQPLVVAMVAPLALGRSEIPSRMVLVALPLGLLGAAIILWGDLDPGRALVDLDAQRYGLWALAATLCSGVAHVTVRALHAENPRAVVFWFQLGVACLAGVLLVVTTGIQVPGRHLWGPLLLTGLFATVGQILMTKAYSLENAATIGAASYVGPLWGVLVDAAVFAVLPGVEVLVGGGIVMATSLLLFRKKDRA